MKYESQIVWRIRTGGNTFSNYYELQIVNSLTLAVDNILLCQYKHCNNLSVYLFVTIYLFL